MIHEIDIISSETLEVATRRLSTLIEDAGAGHWGLLWIEGEARSGRSTLLRHLASTAKERGCVVLCGEGPKGSGRSFDWTGLLRSARPDVPIDAVARELLPEHGAALRRLLTRFDRAKEIETQDAQQPRESREDTRLVRAISGLLDRFAQRIPVVLLLDNFDHASDHVVRQFESILDGTAHASIVVVVSTASPGRGLEEFRERLRTRRRLATVTLRARPDEDEAEVAMRHAEEVLTAHRERGLGPVEADLRLVLARVHLERGEVAAAKTQARKAQALSRDRNPIVLAVSRSVLARVWLLEGHTEQAKREARASARGMRDLSLSDKVLVLLTNAQVFHGLAKPGRHGERDRNLAAKAVATLFELLQGEVHTAMREEALLELTTLGIPVPAETAQLDSPPTCESLADYAPDARIHIRVFGPLQLSAGSGALIEPADWKSHKARHIFGFLLFQRQTSSGVPKERILDAVWPEVPWDAVENTFHATLTILRRVLSPRKGRNWGAVEHGGGCYKLVLDGEPWLDCEAFGRAFANGQRAEGTQNPLRALECYRNAASLYDGDFLEDTRLDWTDPYRERFRQDYQTALFRLGLLTLNAWRPAEALHWAQKLLAADALDERAHRLSMHAHAALGHRKPALDQFERCHTRLRDELGAEPEPETVETLRCIQAGTPLPPLV